MTHYQNDVRTLARVPGPRPAAEALAATEASAQATAATAETGDSAPEGDAFANGLHAAIEASGLSLYTLQQRLAARGATVSVTTLSYWRRGRSQPERMVSLRAVALLEELLGLPEQALGGLLGSPRLRGRWAAQRQKPEARRFEELWPDDPWLLQVLAELEAPPPESLERLSIHDSYLVDAQRGRHLLRVRQVVRATTDRISRCVVGFQTNEANQHPAVFSTVRNARIGRIRQRPDSGFVLGELVLDTPLNTGDTAVFEYELLLPDGAGATNGHRRFTTPVREYVLQVHFDPASVPAHCYHYERDCGEGEDRSRRPLWIGPSGTAHVVSLDQPPGVVGVRWEWT
jgi:transcriptional regulator with XRE-family HTH domain